MRVRIVRAGCDPSSRRQTSYNYSLHQAMARLGILYFSWEGENLSLATTIENACSLC